MRPEVSRPISSVIVEYLQISLNIRKISRVGGLKLRTVQVLVKLPEKLIEKIDQIVSEEGYASRQEFIREVIRERARARTRVDLVEEEVHSRRRHVSVEKVAITPTPRSSLQRGVRREADDP